MRSRQYPIAVGDYMLDEPGDMNEGTVQPCDACEEIHPVEELENGVCLKCYEAAKEDL